MAMVATPWAARVEATANGLLFLLSPKPWPKIATGHPFAGRGPEGRKRLKKMSSALCTSITPVRVGTAGIKAPEVSKFMALNFPKAIEPTDPGRTCSAGVGTGSAKRAGCGYLLSE